MKLKNINLDNRPRERLIKEGVKVLSDVELLAIMLGCGTKELSVIELANYLINEYGLNRLLNMSFIELKKIKGIKAAKATKLMACFEISRRCIKENLNQSLKTSLEVFEYVKSDFLFKNNELIVVLFLDCKLRVIKKIVYDEELVSNVGIPLRQIISECLIVNAEGIIISHNHPSGDIRPSRNDIDSTKNLINILESLNIQLFDHLIVNNDKYYSMNDNKIIY